MPISNAFKATSFSLTLALGILIEGCGASRQSEGYSYECFYDYVVSRSGFPAFETSLFYSPDTSGQRLIVYISVRESRLKFEREGDSYRASYSVLVKLLKKDLEPVVKETSRTILRSSYLGSGGAYDAFFLPFDVGSGEYTAEVTVTDEASKQAVTHTFQKTVPEISPEALSLSDILLLARQNKVDETMKITPFILSNAGLLPDTISIFTASMSPYSSADSISFSLYRLRGRSDRLPDMGAQFRMNRPVEFDPCGERKDTTLVYSYWSSANVDKGYSFIFGSIPKPPPGNYLLKVLVKDETNHTAVSFLRFRVYNHDFPEVSDDIHEMVNSLNYIATAREMKDIVRIKTDSSVKANLLEFWKEHGGYHKMAEYYQRVSQANRLFTNCIEGWKTPMGLFYIVCGQPDAVQCRAWNEWWAYNVSSAHGSMVVVFKLTNASADIDDRVYGVESVYSNGDLWSYYLNRWRTSY